MCDQLGSVSGEWTKVKAAKHLKVVAVASRKVLCVNPQVKGLGSSWRINDECLQLQTKNASKKQILSGVVPQIIIQQLKQVWSIFYPCLACKFEIRPSD